MGIQKKRKRLKI